MTTKAKATIAPRRPPKLDDARQFVKEANVKTSRLSDGKKSTSYVERADGTELKKLTVYLPTEQARSLKIYAAQQDRDMSAIISELLTKVLPAA